MEAPMDVQELTTHPWTKSSTCTIPDLSFLPPGADALDLSFTSASSVSASASTSSTLSARSSLSLPSFSSSTSLSPRPHSAASASASAHWALLRAARAAEPDGLLRLSHLHILRPLGAGHLARVYLCRLKSSPPDAPLFALKVVDLRDDAAAAHALAEARALTALDHPFLPTLYARLDAGRYACFLLDYCAGGDLHALLRRRPGGRLPVAAARFYAAEVLLALEYLHAQGFVYRDLKPENVLLRADGHVVLSDFDLALPAPVEPAVRRRHLRRRRRRRAAPPCFSPAEDPEEWLEFVAEPTAASSADCVGTHEYLAPEIVAGGHHGSAVDWWAFGVFLYELVYGRTPFKGHTKEATLKNILAKHVAYPDLHGGGGGGEVAELRDLVGRLLERDPRRRMGAARGAAELKRHPFFAGVQWPLLRCVAPPVVPVPPPAAEGGAARGVTLGTWNNMGGKMHNVGKGRNSGKREGLFCKLVCWSRAVGSKKAKI